MQAVLDKAGQVMCEYDVHRMLELLDVAGFRRLVVLPTIRPNPIDLEVCFARW